MLDVENVDDILLNTPILVDTETVTLAGAYGRVLREDLLADRDIPPFNRSLMDGIAIDISQLEKGQRKFLIEGTQQTGHPQGILTDRNNCFEIMTGAIIPQGCSAVIPSEDIEIADNCATIKDDIPFQQNQCIHLQSSNFSSGQTIIENGCLLTPQRILAAAAIGKSRIAVTKKITIGILSTGDELVDVDEIPGNFQIRKSNMYALDYVLRLKGNATTLLKHVGDKKENVLQAINELRPESDVIIISGGVSVGKYDFVPEAIKQLGIQTLFHHVKQKPGKPLLFAMDNGATPVFGLPGKPVSTLVCTYRYVLPYLWRMLGLRNISQQWAVLDRDFQIPTDRTYFLPVTIQDNTGVGMVTPIDLAESGDYGTFSHADAFLEIPAGTDTATAETSYKLFRMD